MGADDGTIATDFWISGAGLLTTGRRSLNAQIPVASKVTPNNPAASHPRVALLNQWESASALPCTTGTEAAAISTAESREASLRKRKT
jgi:hypothetical protein